MQKSFKGLGPGLFIFNWSTAVEQKLALRHSNTIQSRYYETNTMILVGDDPKTNFEMYPSKRTQLCNGPVIKQKVSDCILDLN